MTNSNTHSHEVSDVLLLSRSGGGHEDNAAQRCPSDGIVQAEQHEGENSINFGRKLWKYSSQSRFSRSTKRMATLHQALLETNDTVELSNVSANDKYLIDIKVNDKVNYKAEEAGSAVHGLQQTESSRIPLKGSKNDTRIVRTSSEATIDLPYIEIPVDIPQLPIETNDEKVNVQQALSQKRHVPLIGYIILFSALIAISSIGVLYAMQKDVNSPFLKTFWRCSGVALVTFPFAMNSIRRNGYPSINITTFYQMLISGVAYSIYLSGFVISLDYTSVGHATLFNNAHSIIIVLLKFITRQPVARLEALGTLIGILGGSITAFDAPVGKDVQDSSADSNSDSLVVAPSALGDGIAVLGAIGGAFYLMTAKTLRPSMDLAVFMWLLTTITSIIVLIVLMILEGEHISWSFDPNHGLFGWLTLQSDRLLLTALLIFVGDLMGTMGYVCAMKYFEPIMISVVALCEPIAATVLGIITGVDSVPGYKTFFGATLAIGGTLCVITTVHKKGEVRDDTDSIIDLQASTSRPYEALVQ